MEERSEIRDVHFTSVEFPFLSLLAANFGFYARGWPKSVPSWLA